MEVTACTDSSDNCAGASINDEVNDSDQRHPPTEQGISDRPIPLAMPYAGLADLKLHSPSDIIGTPFAVDSPRFEYPFPDSAAGSGSLDQFPVLPSLSSSMSSTSVSSNSTSGSLSPMASTSPLHPVSMFAGSFVPTPPELQGLTPIRVKGRPQTDSVPVPPGVKEKRRRASLGIRKSSDESDCSATQDTASNDGMDNEDKNMSS